MHYHAEFGRARSNRLHISSREPENGSTRVTPPWDGGHGWPHIVDQYGRSSLNSVVKDRGEPQKLGSAAALDGRGGQNVSSVDFVAAKDDGGIEHNWSYKTWKVPIKSSTSAKN